MLITFYSVRNYYIVENQGNMCCQICQHRYAYNFIFYCLGYVMLGMVFVSLGPLLPYMSQHEDRDISSFAVLVFVRALGYLVGSFSIKIAENYLTGHQCLAVGYLVAGVFSVIFFFTENMVLRCIVIFISTMGVSYFDIYSNISTIECFKDDYLESSLQFLHACMGVGGLTVPFVVYLFEEQTFYILGFFQILLAPVPLFLKSPEVTDQQPIIEPLNQQQQEQGQQQKQSQIIQQPIQQQQKKSLPQSSFILYCFMFFFSLACQASFGSWIASYAVIKQYNTKQQATIYNFIFWLSITLTRVISAFVPGSITLKINLMSMLGGVCTLVSVYLIIGVNASVGLVLSAVLVGVFDAPLFGLIQSEPIQYGYEPEQKQVSTFMIFVALGEGSISALVGFLLSYTVQQILFYSISGIFFLMLAMNILQSYLLKSTTSTPSSTKSQSTSIQITNSYQIQ